MHQQFEVIHGDSVEMMRSLESNSVDAVITDPPYCAGGSSEAGRLRAPSQISTRKSSWFVGDNMTTPGLVWLLRAIAFEAERVLVPGGSLLVFCDWRMWSAIVPALESAGLRLQGMVVWDKGSAGMGNGFRPTHELVAHLCSGTGRFFSKSGSNVIRHKRVVGASKEHPTQKPIDLMTDLVRVVTPPAGLVVDPFCGSGSTGVACLQEGRRFLGAERNEAFVETARRRLAEAAMPPPGLAA